VKGQKACDGYATVRDGTDRRTGVDEILQKYINAALLCWEQVKSLEASEHSSQDLCRAELTLLRKHEPDATTGKFLLLLGKVPFHLSFRFFFSKKQKTVLTLTTYSTGAVCRYYSYQQAGNHFIRVLQSSESSLSLPRTTLGKKK